MFQNGMIFLLCVNVRFPLAHSLLRKWSLLKLCVFISNKKICTELNFTCSQLCDEIDEHEKNSQDMIEEEKKRIPGTGIITCYYL